MRVTTRIHRFVIEELISQQKKYLNDFFTHVSHDKLEKVLLFMLKTKGKIVFTGVGKSGFIAQKLAATLSSTGTPAIYLSPLDALHGDVAMVGKEDLFIMLSKSGNTEELLKMVPYIRLRQAKVMGWFCKQDCLLRSHCDEVLYLPLTQELCPHDLAPTTSSELQLIVGNLMTAALMKKRAFTVEQYALNHPIGSIGVQAKFQVKDLMLEGTRIPTCSPQDSLSQSLMELTEKRCGCVVVIDESRKPLGIFTDGDLRRAIQKDPAALSKSIKELMTPHFTSISPEKRVQEALEIMENPQKKIMMLPVVENEALVGLICMHDILSSNISV